MSLQLFGTNVQPDANGRRMPLIAHTLIGGSEALPFRPFRI